MGEDFGVNMNMKNAARNFADIDLSDLNERIAVIDKSKLEFQEAEAKAEARCTEISLKLANWREVDAAAIADAIVSGQIDGATTNAGTLEELTNERAGLRAAIGELRRRAQGAHDTRRALQLEAKERVAPLADPLVAQFKEEALTAARTLVTSWTSAQAISRSLGNGEADALARTLEEVVAALYDNFSLLVKERPAALPVDEDIVAVLSGLDGKGPSLPFHAFTSIPVPITPANVIMVPMTK